MKTMLSNNERQYLRDLAKEYLEIANLPVMKERTQLWYRHNEGQVTQPLIVIETLSFEQDLLPQCKCESPLARNMERELLRHIVNFRAVGDDKVCPDYFSVPMCVDVQWFGLDQQKTFAESGDAPAISYKEEHFIKDLGQDLPKLRPSVLRYDKPKTDDALSIAADILGDIMPVRAVNESLQWFFGLSQKIISLMGMEAMMYATYEEPEALKALYEFVCDDTIAILRQQEELGLLTMNNGNDYAGAGSYGFSKELQTVDPVVSQNLWGNLNSQETVCISPDMYGEFAYPSYHRLAKEFGLVYYGCCEPVHTIWDDYISKLPNLRKVSVSPWCDEAFMGERLRGSGIIYSRKPHPGLFGVDPVMNAEGYNESIRNTLRCAKGCALEFIQRDVYILSGNTQKPRQAVEIIRNAISDIWE